MTQAKTYISTPDSTNDSTCTYDAVWNELATSPFSGPRLGEGLTSRQRDSDFLTDGF
ncbi:hypothetical protein L6Q85_10755 [bacterium]|nr:hypothetical protein [bacterium]NUP93330.1 hypothetical protein [Candidatus Omnitrophota bacterium]